MRDGCAVDEWVFQFLDRGILQVPGYKSKITETLPSCQFTCESAARSAPNARELLLVIGLA